MAKETWRSVRDQLDYEWLLIVVKLVNINANVKDAWKYVGSDGYIILN